MTRRRATRSGGAPWKLIALLVLVVLLAFFFFQNGDDAPIEFLWFDGDWPLWAVIGVSVLVGIALDRLVSWQLAAGAPAQDQTN